MIGVANGKRKLEAIHSALRGRLVNGLITDDETAEADENRALRYDFGEGLLEIGLVLTSLYFISRKTMFPIMGAISAVAGVAIAITGLLI